MPHHSGHPRRHLASALLGAFAFATFVPCADAQPGSQIQSAFTSVRTELDAAVKKDLKAASDVNTFWDTLDVLRQEDERERAVKGKMSIGFSSDETGYAPDSLFKVNLGAELSRGAYPAELTFRAELSVQLGGSDSATPQAAAVFKEDVTHLVGSYQYHHYRWVEYYAFLERFSDSYMGIQQRYETGAGATFGAYMLERKQSQSLEPRDKLTKLLTLYGGVKERLDAIEKDNPSKKFPGKAEYAALRERATNLSEAARVKASALFLGIAISAFAELEQVKFDAVLAPPLGAPAGTPPTRKSFALGADHRFRWTVRPTVIVRPADEFQIAVYPYFKLPLDGPYRVDDVLDYRIDLLTSIRWNLAQSATGNEQVGFVFKFDRHIDNVPPALPADLIAAEPAGTVFIRSVAPRQHDMISLSLAVAWGS
jgi:hypothetical protein